MKKTKQKHYYEIKNISLRCKVGKIWLSTSVLVAQNTSKH